VNLIFICSDTFRADHLDCYGDTQTDTPNLDKLAEEGVVFQSVFAEGLPTINARRVFITGRRLFPGWEAREHKGDHLGWQPGWHALAEDDVTIAELLQAKGYTTAFVTDTYHMFKPTGNFHRGFDAWHWIRGQEQDRYITGPREKVDFKPYVREGTYHRRRFQGLEQYLLNVMPRRKEEDYFVAQVMSKAADWLVDNVGNRPFFMWVDCFDPHEPWDPPKEYADRYCPAYSGIEPIVGAGRTVDKYTPEEWQRLLALYRGEVTLVDKWIGHLLDRLEELDLVEETIVVFTSDHGTILGEQGVVHKANYMLIAPETQIPLIIRHPDPQWRGKRAGGLVQAQDIMPTLLKLLGEEIPDSVQGEDMWPLVTGERETLHDYVITAYNNYASVRDAEWNYIVPYAEPHHGDKKPPRLYNLRRDPREETNVIADHPDVAKEMQRRLDEHMTE